MCTTALPRVNGERQLEQDQDYIVIVPFVGERTKPIFFATANASRRTGNMIGYFGGLGPPRMSWRTREGGREQSDS